jgi:hypothetical protein
LKAVNYGSSLQSLDQALLLVFLTSLTCLQVGLGKMIQTSQSSEYHASKISPPNRISLRFGFPLINVKYNDGVRGWGAVKIGGGQDNLCLTQYKAKSTVRVGFAMNVDFLSFSLFFLA